MCRFGTVHTDSSWLHLCRTGHSTAGQYTTHHTPLSIHHSSYTTRHTPLLSWQRYNPVRCCELLILQGAHTLHTWNPVGQKSGARAFDWRTRMLERTWTLLWSYRSICSYRKLPPPACPGTACMVFGLMWTFDQEVLSKWWIYESRVYIRGPNMLGWTLCCSFGELSESTGKWLPRTSARFCMTAFNHFWEWGNCRNPTQPETRKEVNGFTSVPGSVTPGHFRSPGERGGSYWFGQRRAGGFGVTCGRPRD